MLTLAAMFFLGFLAATIGSAAGLGGAFIAIPILRMVFGFSPALTAGTSLAMVTANVASATIAFFRQGRVDLKLALLMGGFAIPGSFIGVWFSRSVQPRNFDIAYGIFLIVLAIDVFFHAERSPEQRRWRLPWQQKRTLYDRVNRREISYTESPPLAAGTGVVTGCVSSFFGIGGGVVTLPVLLRVFAIPAHIASATSHTIILISAPFGVAAQIAAHNVAWPDILPLAGGALVGGQVGAAISPRIAGPMFLRFLAVVLSIAAISLLWQQVH